MDFKAFDQRRSDIYDGYTKLSFLMPDLLANNTLDAPKAAPYIEKWFGDQNIPPQSEQDIEALFASYMDNFHQNLLKRLDALITIYHASVLQMIFVKRTVTDPSILDSDNDQAQLAMGIINDDIEATIRKINNHWPDPIEQRARIDEICVSIDQMPIDVNRRQLKKDTNEMYEISCSADLDIADACLSFCEADIAALSLMQQYPEFEARISGHEDLDFVVQYAKERLIKFSSEGAEAIKEAYDNLEAAYNALHVANHDEGTGQSWRFEP